MKHDEPDGRVEPNGDTLVELEKGIPGTFSPGHLQGIARTLRSSAATTFRSGARWRRGINTTLRQAHWGGSNLEVDADKHELLSHEKGGHAGMLFESRRYRWESGKLTIVESVSQCEDDPEKSTYRMTTRRFASGRSVEETTRVVRAVDDATNASTALGGIVGAVTRPVCWISAPEQSGATSRGSVRSRSR